MEERGGAIVLNEQYEAKWPAILAQDSWHLSKVPLPCIDHVSLGSQHGFLRVGGHHAGDGRGGGSSAGGVRAPAHPGVGGPLGPAALHLDSSCSSKIFRQPSCALSSTQRFLPLRNDGQHLVAVKTALRFQPASKEDTQQGRAQRSQFA